MVAEEMKLHYSQCSQKIKLYFSE